MRKLCGVLVCASLAVAFVTRAASAASISLTPVYSQAYDASGAALGKLPLSSIPAGTVLEYDVRMSISGLQAGENFAAVVFNVNMSSGLGKADPFSAGSFWLSPGAARQIFVDNGNTGGPVPYQTFPNAGGSGAQTALSYAQYRGTTGSATQSAHWASGDNADLGTNTNDLLQIAVDVTKAEANNRRYGESARPPAAGGGYADQLSSASDPGTLLGSFFVTVGNQLPQTVTILPDLNPTWQTYTNNAGGAGSASAQPIASFSGGVSAINTVPEPASLALMGFAGLGLIAAARRRRSS